MAKTKGLKVVGFGGREFDDYEAVKEACKNCGFEIGVIGHGDAPGADKLFGRYAKENNIPCETFPAEWNNVTAEWAEVRTRYNKWKKCNEEYAFNAGFKRNSDMAEWGEAAIKMPGGNGTDDMLKKAKEKGLKIYVHKENEEDKEYEYSL